MQRPGWLLSVSLLLGGAAGAVACDDENRAACESFEERFYGLPCAEGLSSGVDCNAYADYPCPLTDYFQCLEGAERCEGDVFTTERETCVPLLDCQG